MFPKLSWKLTFFMVLVSALTIFLASTLTNQALDRQFAQYLQSSQLDRNKQVLETVRELYLSGADKKTIEEQLEVLGLATSAEIVITEEDGGRMMGHHMMGRGPSMMMGHGSKMMARNTTENLVLPDGTRATIEIIPAFSGEHILQEMVFRKAVNRSIFFAAFLSIGSALVLSSLFSWGLTKPLNQLVTMVRQVGSGDLKQRAELSGKDEFSYLGQEFNQMAANLERQEQLRVKLTNDMAHEFRTPLTTIQAYLEAMHEGVLESNADNLALVLDETQRLKGLLAGLQELAKLEKPLMKTERINIGDLLDSLVNSLDILAKEKGITLDWQWVDGMFTEGDGEMLAIALRNILVNALKYTQSNGRVVVDLSKTGGQIVVKISDTGIGIEAQELPFIFERFYRTDLSRSRETGGTGIGLAVSAEIVAGHGGEIQVESELGKGSTFIVILPSN